MSSFSLEQVVGWQRTKNRAGGGRRAHWREMLREYTMLRVRLVSNFVKRGLGITPPRGYDVAALPRGLTFVLPGIEAESIFTYGICDGLLEGGVDGAVRVFNWGLPLPGGYLANLCRIDRNRRRAADLAAAIVAYQDAFPGRPVNLVAQSGGCGVAVFAAEVLPQGYKIESIVLLNGALSPTYNLGPALRNTQRGILNVYSEKDNVVLGWGTRIFGTTDRKFCKACGCVSFSKPADLNAEDAAAYAKLEQLAWCEDMCACNHFGGHITSASEAFLAKYVAPWMRRVSE